MVNQINTSSVVCLGGGTATRNLLKGLSGEFSNITTILSMADDGGSGGRLRRLYNLPLGNLIDCMASFPGNDQLVASLMTYRFPGERYGKDHHLGGHKLGNLMLVALTQITGDFSTAVAQLQRMFGIQGKFLPATKLPVTISAITSEGQEVFGEEQIDLGKYKGKKVLQKVLLHPSDAKAGEGVVDSIMQAKIIICGPGDLYTTLLPALIVPEINKALQKTKAQKIFVVNVANKPVETRGYTVTNFIQAIKKHIGTFPFDTVLINNNFNNPIPQQYKYTYVPYDLKDLPTDYKYIEADVVDQTFPLSHDPQKLAKVIQSLL